MDSGGIGGIGIAQLGLIHRAMFSTQAMDMPGQSSAGFA